jgi:IS5 family transposase
MNQSSFLSLAHYKKLRCERFLDEMNAIIPWESFLDEMAPHIERKQTGRKRTDLLLLLKIHFLQQWYNLSDPGVEEAIYDRNSFQKFLGIDLLAQTVPDETTILNFRHFMEEHDLQAAFFDIVKQLLEGKHLLMKEGTIVDATIVEAPSSTKNEEKRRDPDMTSTKKGNVWHFGMKAHVGVDAKSGLVHTVASSTAKVHDKAKMNELFHGEERAKFGDKGYVGDQEKREARSIGVFWGILDRGRKNHPLSGSQKKRNKKLSSVRAKVEHPFQVIKCQWGYVKVRYRGLKKNTLHLQTLFMLVNLFKVRRELRFAT